MRLVLMLIIAVQAFVNFRIMKEYGEHYDELVRQLNVVKRVCKIDLGICTDEGCELRH